MSSIEKIADTEKSVLNRMMRSKIKSIIKEEATSSLDIKLEGSHAYNHSIERIDNLRMDIASELDDAQCSDLNKLLSEYENLIKIIKQNCTDLISYL